MDQNNQTQVNAVSGIGEPESDVTEICGRYFDDAWYISKYGEISGTPADVLTHYLSQGGAEGFDPHPLFASAWYLKRNPDVAEAGLNPFYHFIKYGGAEGRDPHPAFDSQAYMRQHPDFEADFKNPWIHYLNSRDLPEALGDAIADWYRAVVCSDAETASRVDARNTPTAANKLVAKSNVAVVYLARSADGSAADFKRFLVSYQKYKSGMAHDLVIIRKGQARSPDARRAIESALFGISVQYIDIDDDGFDIQAYLKVAKSLTHEFVCFLNTHSEIRADDWLLKLHGPFADPGVGVTAATASYESIQDSIMANDKAIWLVNTERHIDPFVFRLPN
jgi:hypothetical protein